MQHRLTWLAIILTFIFLIPGQLAGWLFAYVYQFLMGGVFDGNNLLDWPTNGWFSRIALEGFSNGLRGVVAGGLAMLVCGKLLKHADYNVVAYSNAAVVVALTIITAVLGVANRGLGLELLGLIANTVGVIGGLFAVAAQVSTEQPVPMSTRAAGVSKD